MQWYLPIPTRFDQIHTREIQPRTFALPIVSILTPAGAGVVGV